MTPLASPSEASHNTWKWDPSEWLLCCTQVAVEPLLQAVYAELLGEEGAELYTRLPNTYLPSTTLAAKVPLTWQQVRRDAYIITLK
jgi:hypothetical protein